MRANAATSNHHLRGGLDMDIKSKRNGPKHRVRTSRDPYPCVNDWFEAILIAVALFGIGGGIIGLYHLSQAV
jgi:hypothetical protein